MRSRSPSHHSLRSSINRFPVLVKHMMLRFMNNDVMHFDRRGRENLVALMTVLSVLGGVTAHLLLRLYLFGMIARPDSIWLEETYFLTLIMVAMGILATMIWDSFSLDEKDFRNLLATPITPAEIFVAKGAALILFALVITIVLNVIATIIFTLYLAKRSDLPVLQLVVAHLAVAFTAGLFVFSLVAAVQGVFKTILSNRWYRRLGPIIRSAFFALFITLLFWFPTIYPLLTEMRREGSLILLLYPPLWFVGLYESILNHPSNLYQAQQFMIITAMTTTMGIYFLTLPRHFRRFLRQRPRSKFSEKSDTSQGIISRQLQRLFLRHPHQKAAFHLARTSINRSGRHRHFVAVFILLPLILVGCELLFLYLKEGTALFMRPNLYLTSVSMVFLLFITLGTRLLATIPFHPSGSWLLDLAGINDNRQLVIGLKKALYLLIFLPMVLFFGSFYITLWPLPTALFHLAYSVGVLIILVSVLFTGFLDIPFFPPRTHHHSTRWISWITRFAAMLGSLAILTYLGLVLAGHPDYTAIFYLLLTIFLLLTRWVYHYRHRELVFTYYPGPQSVVPGLDMARSRQP